MNVAKDKYQSTCPNCGKGVWIRTPAQLRDAVASKAAKWVRCAECQTITRCERVQK